MKEGNKQTEGGMENNPFIMKLMAHVRKRTLQIAFFLQRQTERLSHHAKQKGLILFCLLGIGCSISVIIFSVGTAQPFRVSNQIRLPPHMERLPHLSTVKDSFITSAQFKRIHRFEQYLAKQQNDASGRFFYDSLTRARPYLLDSLHAIDSLFNAQ